MGSKTYEARKVTLARWESNRDALYSVGLGIDLLWNLTDKLYETGMFPSDMLKSVFITLPMIPGTLDCSNHQTISLMSHILKIHFETVLQRIWRKLLPEISEVQHGFIKDRGTRNAIFNIHTLSERSTEHQQYIYVVFMEYVRTQWALSPTWKNPSRRQRSSYSSQCLRPSDDTCMILQWIDKGAPDRKRSGTREHCISRSVQPVWRFNSTTCWLHPRGDLCEWCPNKHQIYERHHFDSIIWRPMETSWRSEWEQWLKCLSINCKKTKCMVISRSEPPPACTLTIRDTSIEQVDSFNYLGSIVTSDGRCRKYGNESI